MGMSSTPLRFYAVGWAAEELQASPNPADFPDFPEAVWVHTGADWIPLSPVVAAVWRQARAIPATEDAVLAAFHQENPQDSAPEALLWTRRHRLWMPWPLTLEIYGSTDALAWWTLVPQGPAPDALPDALWRSAPSIAQIVRWVMDQTTWSHAAAAAAVLDAIPQWLRKGRAHWLYGRAGLPDGAEAPGL